MKKTRRRSPPGPTGSPDPGFVERLLYYATGVGWADVAFLAWVVLVWRWLGALLTRRWATKTNGNDQPSAPAHTSRPDP